MRTKAAPIWWRWTLVCFAPLLLISCASDPEVRVVTETSTIEVPVEVVKPLPASLTDPIPYPASLGGDVTVGDLLDRVFELYDLLDQANRDRASAAELTQPSASDTPP